MSSKTLEEMARELVKLIPLERCVLVRVSEAEISAKYAEMKKGEKHE